MKMSDEIIHKLIDEAFAARNNAYSPYSHYMVGASALMGEGNIYRGANIENASYPCGICAERNAIFHGAAMGERVLHAVCIVGGPEGEKLENGNAGYAYPCGVCRQVMREFSDPENMMIIVATSKDNYKTFSLAQLLPESFGPEALSSTK